MVCDRGYSLNGCGRCYFRVSDGEHLPKLDSISVLATIVELLDRNKNSYLDMKNSIVVCNGTIVTIPDAEVTEDKAVKINRFLVSTLLLLWCNDRLQRDDAVRCMCAIQIYETVPKIGLSGSTQDIIEMLEGIQQSVGYSTL